MSNQRKATKTKRKPNTKAEEGIAARDSCKYQADFENEADLQCIGREESIDSWGTISHVDLIVADASHNWYG